MHTEKKIGKFLFLLIKTTFKLIKVLFYLFGVIHFTECYYFSVNLKTKINEKTNNDYT